LIKKGEGALRFEIYCQPEKPVKKIWGWRLRGTKEGVIALGEGYRTRAECLRAVELLRGTTSLTPIVEDA
jgi:uncharacterized protein YegP (UPF0339 family)